MHFDTKEQLESYAQGLQRRTESNRKVQKMLNDRIREANRAQVREMFGVDIDKNPDLQMMDESGFINPNFSVGNCLRAVQTGLREGKFRTRETEPLSAFSALFRAMVNNVAANWYDLAPRTFEKIVAVTPSSHAVEPYAPMHRGGRPHKTAPSEQVKEQQIIAPFDIQIANAKVSAISSVPNELIKYDMTGQVMQRIQDIGPNMEQYEEAYFAARFYQLSTASVSVFGDLTYGSQTKPGTETSSTWPWSTAFLGGGKNRLTTYALFSPGNLQELDNLLFQQLDANANKMVVNPDTLLFGSALRFPARTLLNSTWYPASTPQYIAADPVATATVIGAAYADNVMKGLYTPVESRYLPQKAYAIGMAHRGMIQQVASGLMVTQENPNAGASFDRGEMRFKSEKYFEMDWIDPRFWAQGNDGSV